MAFPAKYPGKCDGCKGSIRVGEQIHWERPKTWHLACKPAGAARPAAPAAAPRQVTLAAWESYAARVVRPGCSGCEDGCLGCDNSQDALASW